MSDPIRWSEGGDASELTRELLEAGQQRVMPENERRALWASIALALPAAPPGPLGASPSAVGGGTLAASLAKGAVVASLVASLGWGAAVVLRPAPSDAQSPAVVASVTSVTSTSAPAAAPPLPAAASTPTMPAGAPPSATPPTSATRPSLASQLRQESVAVLEARAALRAGDAARCLTLLEQARARFPRGALGQEREALTIEALARAGQSAAAQRRAAAFLRAHPQSPYVADLRRIAGR